jgi:uncharacterized protein YecE (DUF72 family)
MANSWIGISGWRYASWRGSFYPPGLAQRRELEFAGEQFDSVEINGSFYSLQRADSFERWARETPDDFVFAVKGSRYVTHMLRMRGVEVALANFFAQGLLALGPKLGPVLWQLPARQEFDADQLDAFFSMLPRTSADAAVLARGHDARVKHPSVDLLTDQRIRYALEVRHESFDDPAAFALLERHDVSLVVADTAGTFPDIRAVTSDHVYVRLHGDEELYTSGYSDDALDRWADAVRGWLASGLDVYVYFDNDAKVRAPFDALGLRRRVRGET